MKYLHFQHVPFEGLGLIADFIAKRDEIVEPVHLYAGEEIKGLDVYDGLIITGGPMSVHDESLHPWLIQEKQWIREFMKMGRPILGICLGAQLLIDALGGQVYPNRVKEIGWWPLTQVEGDFTEFQERMKVLHWHGETFDLPSGATHLFSSEACRNQGFLIGKNVLGLQFHLEMGLNEVRGILNHCREELIDGEWVAGEKAILSPTSAQLRQCEKLLNELLEKHFFI